MAETALWAVQQGIYAALNGNVSVDGSTINVYDHVPQTSAYPYIVIGDGTEFRHDTHGEPGKDITFTLHVWSRYAGWKEASRILEAVDALLDRTSITVTGWRTVLCENEFTDQVDESDGMTRHIVARYRVLVDK